MATPPTTGIPGFAWIWPTVAGLAVLAASSMLAVLAGAILVTPVATAASASDAHAGVARKGKRVYCTRHHRPRGCMKPPKSARRPPKRDQQGPGSLTPANVVHGGGMGGGPGDHRHAALQWALSQRRQPIWSWRCQRFVEEAYGTRGRYDTAKQAASKLDLKRRPVATAPAGSLVFFAADENNRGYGHVGLSLGDGKMISALSRVKVTDVARNPYWQGLYLGWADAPPEWPGRIPLPPGPTIEDPGLTVRVTAPAFGTVLTGTASLAATATGARGVTFHAYYASDPANPATRAWRLIGPGRRTDAGWVVEWDTTAVPDQGNPRWGTVNVAAVALGEQGAETATRDYRWFAIRNAFEAPPPLPPVVPPTPPLPPPPPVGSPPQGALLSAERVDATSARVSGWARDPDDLTTPVTVTAALDGGSSTEAQADQPLEPFGRHGFSLVVAVDESAKRVCVRAANLGPGWDAQIGDCLVIYAFGDVNRNGTLECGDLSWLRARYGQKGGAEDLNRDGTVNIVDLSILLSRIHSTCP